MSNIENPFVGPRTFEEKERDFFFGRSREARELLSLTISEQLVLFYAQSGAGKSSLVNTSLIPDLKRKGFKVFPVGRVGGDAPSGLLIKNIYVFNLLRKLAPTDSDLTALADLSLSAFLAGQGRKALSETASGNESVAPERQVLIIDQFEELFSTHHEEWKKREEFFTGLAQALQENPYLWVMLVMREDYIALLEPYEHLLPSRLRIRYYMQRLGRQAAIEAVEGPAAKVNRPFAAGVAEKLTRDLSSIKVRTLDNKLVEQEGQYVEPVQLQVVCSSLWEKLPSDVTQVTQTHLDEYVGDVDKALGQYYEERVQAVAEGDIAVNKGVKQRAIREWFGQRLITGDGIRNMVAREGGGESGGLDDDVVQEFVKRGDLVRAENRGGATFYELTHDRLVEPILENNVKWFADHSSLLQQQTVLWIQQKRGNGMLASGKALRTMRKEAAAAANTGKLTEDERAFLWASIVAERNRIIAWISTGIALLIVTSLSFVAMQANNEAQIQRSFAETQSAAAVANANLAATNEALAQENLQDAIDASRSAVEARALAEQNQIAAQAQRSAARAQIYQSRPGGLYTSTLLAIDSLRRSPSDESEEILRKNISLLPLPVAQFSQDGRINEISLSPDQTSNRFVTASADGTACVWQIEPADPRKILCTPSVQASVNDAVFSPDGSLIVMGDQAGLVQILDAGSGKVLHAYQRVGLQSSTAQFMDVSAGNLQEEAPAMIIPVQGISISTSNGQVAVAYKDGMIPIFELETGRINAQVTTISSPQVMAFSPDGRLLAVGTETGQVSVWDLSSGKIFNPVRHREGVLAIAFSPDSRLLATGGKDNMVAISSVSSGMEIMRLTAQNWVRDIAFSPDGTWVVTVSDDHQIRVLDPATGMERFAMSQEGIVTAVTISSDSRWIATTGDDQTVRVWNSATGAEVLKIPLEAGGSVLAFSPDSRYLVSTDQDGGIQIWDISVMPAPQSFLELRGVVDNVQYSPSGELVAFSAGNRFWLQGPEEKDVVGRNFPEFQTEVKRLIFSPDSGLLGFLTEGNEVAFYTIQTRSLKKLAVSNLVQAIAFSPGSREFITADSFGNIQAWDVKTAQAIGNPVQRTFEGFTLATSSQFLALGAQDKISIVGADIQDEISTVDASGRDALLVLSHDGSLLASAMPDGRVDVWKSQDGQFSLVTSFVKDQVTALAFSPAGNMFAVGTSEDVFLMDLASGKEIARIPHPDRVNDLSFSADGTRLVTASARILQFWELSSLPQIPTEDLVGAACSRLFKNFSQAEWETIFPGETYTLLCENLPVAP